MFCQKTLRKFPGEKIEHKKNKSLNNDDTQLVQLGLTLSRSKHLLIIAHWTLGVFFCSFKSINVKVQRSFGLRRFVYKDNKAFVNSFVFELNLSFRIKKINSFYEKSRIIILICFQNKFFKQDFFCNFGYFLFLLLDFFEFFAPVELMVELRGFLLFFDLAILKPLETLLTALLVLFALIELLHLVRLLFVVLFDLLTPLLSEPLADDNFTELPLIELTLIELPLIELPFTEPVLTELLFLVFCFLPSTLHLVLLLVFLVGPARFSMSSSILASSLSSSLLTNFLFGSLPFIP